MKSRPASFPQHLFGRAVAGLLCLLVSACGGGGSNGNTPPPAVLPAAGLELIAGNTGGPGYADDIGTNARFNGPDGLATDSSGNIYVADRANAAIRKITPEGVVITIAGSSRTWGYADGPVASAQFYAPQSIAVDGTGNVFVADYTGVRKISTSGIVSTVLPTSSASWPQSVTVDNAGNLYVADTYRSTIIKVSPSLAVTTIAGSDGVHGSVDGTGAAASFGNLADIAADASGNLFVVDSYAVRKITPAGVVTTLAGNASQPGSTDGAGTAARFTSPSRIVSTATGTLFVIDRSTIRKITPAGEVSTVSITSGPDPFFGAGNNGGQADLTLDAAGNLYIADSLSNAVTKITPAGAASTFAGMPGPDRSSVDGTGVAARFLHPSSVTPDASGNLYVIEVPDYVLFGLTLRKIDAGGTASTLAGSGLSWSKLNAGGMNANIARPTGLVRDTAGNTYVIDGPVVTSGDVGMISTGGYTVRKISPDGVVSLVAGEYGVYGSNDGTGAAAHFRALESITIDRTGNLYVTDANRVRKITPAGVVTTLATIPGTDAASEPSLGGIVIDASGNIFVTSPSRRTIEKIAPNGSVTTLAGTAGVAGDTDGTGAQALFRLPEALTIDTAGNLYAADKYGYTIRKITPTGQVTRIAGVPGEPAVKLGQLPGRLGYTTGLAFIGNNTLAVVSDNSVLKLALP